MGIEHLQQLDIRGDDRDEVAPIPPLQLGWTQPTQGPKHLVPDEGQQLESDEVVAGLLSVPQHAPQQGKGPHAGEQRRQAQRGAKAQNTQRRISAEHGEKDGAQVARQPHEDGQQHIARQRLYQPDQPGHHLKSASAFHALLPSLP